MAGHSISNCLAWTLSTEAQSQSCCVQHSGAFTAGVRPIWGCWISRTKSREGSLKERLDTGSGMMKQKERGITAPEGNALGHQQCQVPERNSTPEGGCWAEGRNQLCDWFLVMTRVSSRDVQETTRGRELYKEMLKWDCSTNQKSKERGDCLHVAICVDISLKIFRHEQKTRGTKPGLYAMRYHGEG